MNVALTGIGFLLGSIPFGLILGMWRTGRDVRQIGSGNIGASNVARLAGRRIGIAVAVLDMLKGVAAVLLGRTAGLDDAGLALVALAAVLGHDFSLFLRFRGGKGIATTLGVAAVLAVPATLLTGAVWLITWGIWGYSSVASLAGVATLPLFMALTGRPTVDVVLASFLLFLAILKHWPNILRLMAGTEARRGRGG